MIAKRDIATLSDAAQLVVFGLDGQRYGLPLDRVERIVRAVEITLLPAAPAIVLGVVNIAGLILPVLNLRRRFGLPEREIRPTDQLLIAMAKGRPVSLVIDEALGVIECPAAEIIESAQIGPGLGLGQIQGVVKLEDGLVLIHDLERFLSLDEALALDQAMKMSEGGVS